MNRNYSMALLILLTIVCTQTGCTGVNHRFDWRKPIALNMNPPEGPFKYQKGWIDGCTSGLASTNTKFHLTLGSYRFTLDNKLRYDSLYNKAWKYGYNHCGYSMKSLAQYSF